MSSSSSSVENTAYSPSSPEQTHEQSEAVLAQLDAVKQQLNALAREIDTDSPLQENLNPEGFIGFDESTSLQVSTIQSIVGTSEPSGLSRSLDNLSFVTSEPHGILAATSRESFTAALPLFSRETSPELPAVFNVRKTRQSVREGFRSPLRDFSQLLPRSHIVSYLELPVINMAPYVREEVSGKDGSGHNPQWALFIIKKDSFKRNLAKDMVIMRTEFEAEDVTPDDYEDILTDLEGLETELKDLELTWNTVVDSEDIEVAAWTDVGDELRDSRKDINKFKKRVQKVSGTSAGLTGNSGGGSGVNADTLAALRSSAQAPKVDLPTFSGEITE